jgi:hypothetical protein
MAGIVNTGNLWNSVFPRSTVDPTSVNTPITSSPGATQKGLKTAQDFITKTAKTGVSNVTSNPIGVGFSGLAFLLVIAIVVIFLPMMGVGGSDVSNVGIIASSIIGGLLILFGGYYFYSSTTGEIPVQSSLTSVGSFLTSPATLTVISVVALIGIIAGTFVSQGGNISNFAKYLGAFIGVAVGIFLISYVSQQVDKPGNFVPTTFLRILYYFLPYGLVTYTALADLFNQEYKYFGGIVSAAVMFILNRTISYFVTGKGIDLTDSNYCGLPGLGGFGSNLFPQAMLFNLTTLSYIAALISLDTEFDSKYTIPSWTFLVSIFFASSYLNIKNDCFDVNKGHSYWLSELINKGGQGSKPLGITLTLLATLAASVAAGWSGAAVQHFYISGGNASTGGNVSTTSKLDPKKAETVDGETIINASSTPSDTINASDIIAEIYQNGKKIATSLSK